MKQSRQPLAKIMAQRTATVNSKQLAKDIAGYLLAEKRTADLDSLMRDIQQIRADQGIVEVNAVTSHELSSNSIAEIKSTIKKNYPNAKTIIVNPVIDPDIVGGVRLTLANEQLDLSVRSKLNKFKQLTTA
ncbi:MAG: F0F1 ATP synthase subunit delta [bacterium]